jgi:hypothetical protein
MKKLFGLVMLAALLAGAVAGCSYGGVAVTGDKAIVARNDAFLFGILRKVSVCKVADSGLTSCQSTDSP